MPSQPDIPLPISALRLPANCTTIAAEELRNEFVFAADFRAGTVIDASDVQNVGQAVLQLLVAARREAIDMGKHYEIIGASEAFRSRVNGCCLAEAIGLPKLGASTS